MRVWCIALAAVALAIVQRPVAAQDKAAAAMQAKVLKQIMARFDLNKDGDIDDEEKAKAGEQLKQQFADGKLPPAEVAMLKEMAARLQGGGGFPAGGLGGPIGPGGPDAGFGGPATGGSPFSGQVPPEVLKKFDKNKNGKLDEDEQKAAMAALGPKKSRKEQLLDKLDLNGDGKVSKEEREQVAAQRKAEQEEKKAEAKAEAEEKKAKAKKKEDQE